MKELARTRAVTMIMSSYIVCISDGFQPNVHTLRFPYRQRATLAIEDVISIIYFKGFRFIQ
jgi:hypothetical protein